ncbi:hypothetical protein EVAR_35504_1 [Eumeta japonica]|uniref:Peptidase aspartic putative domain-containing protein n=1 Tax=Eumeta variegata TaxID=151549 RepID=A0A4C1X8Z6_EUMVA|nr:hypothetical protein EVAR_35504_1 [Eumeta japonica]
MLLKLWRPTTYVRNIEDSFGNNYGTSVEIASYGSSAAPHTSSSRHCISRAPLRHKTQRPAAAFVDHNRIVGIEKSHIRHNEFSQSEINSNSISTTLYSSMSDSDSFTSTSEASKWQSRSVALSTALVEAADVNDKYHVVCELLDNGSQHSIITEKLCNRFNIPTLPSTNRFSGV